MNGLNELIESAVARKKLYAALSVALALYALWQLAKGNVEQFIVSIASSAATTLARSKVDITDADEPDAEG